MSGSIRGSTAVAILGSAIAVFAVAGVIVLLTRPHPAASRLTLAASPLPASTAAARLAGRWTVDQGSQVGYRVKERFIDQPADTEAIARTTAVSGTLMLSRRGTGLSLDFAQVSADLSQLQSTDPHATRGSAVRDRFVARIYLETAVYPMATFAARSQSLSATSAATSVPLSLAGTFTLHGVTRDVTVPVQVVQNGDRLEVAGSFPVHLADYRIDVPQVPFTTASPDGTAELHLFLRRA